MSEIEKNCKNYTNFERIGTGSYANIYKAQIKQQIVMLQLKKLIKKDIMN